jgi:hypothetical protein
VCETQADCAGGTTCTEVNAGNDLACLPPAENNITVVNNPTGGCASDAECSGATPVCSASGVCVAAGDPCATVDCQAGFSCVAGQCVEDSTNNPPGCTSDTQCGADEVCEAGVCVEEGGGDECEFTSQCPDFEVCSNGTCVRDPDVECLSDRDCGADEFCNADAECEAEVDETAVLCESYCANIYGSCPKSQCGGLTASDRSDADRNYDLCLNGGSSNGQSLQPCVDRYASDSQFRQGVDNFGNQACGSTQLREVHCYQLGYGDKCSGCEGWTVGDPCSVESQCDAGPLQVQCIPQEDPNTGDPTGFRGGYCVGLGCNAGSGQANQVDFGPQTGCGFEAVCVNQDLQGTVTGVCFGLCTGPGTCRTGYDCTEVGTFTDGSTLGICVPAGTPP